MKTKILGLLAVALVIPSQQAGAANLNFDDSGNFAPVSGVAATDFTWTWFYTLDAVSYGTVGLNGYTNGMVSARNVAFNLGGMTASVASIGGGDFLFNGAFFTSAWRNGLQIDVVGARDGVDLFSQTFSVDTSGPTWVGFGWTVDVLRFSSSGGVKDPNMTGDGTMFVMENFAYNNVPEPGTLALLGLGLAGLGVSRRRKAD